MKDKLTKAHLPIILQKNNVPSIPPPQANSEEYFASLLPNALYDGGVVVYEPCDIECVGVEYFGIHFC